MENWLCNGLRSAEFLAKFRTQSLEPWELAVQAALPMGPKWPPVPVAPSPQLGPLVTLAASEQGMEEGIAFAVATGSPGLELWEILPLLAVGP